MFIQPAFVRARLLSTQALRSVGLGEASFVTLLAVVVGLVLALPASGRYGRALRTATRFLLNLLRSIPELVWATLMVLAAGLGPFAGTLALGMHTSGVLGRLFAEALENAPEEPSESLRQSGASRSFACATWRSRVSPAVAISASRARRVASRSALVALARPMLVPTMPATSSTNAVAIVVTSHGFRFASLEI